MVVWKWIGYSSRFEKATPRPVGTAAQKGGLVAPVDISDQVRVVAAYDAAGGSVTVWMTLPHGVSLQSINVEWEDIDSPATPPQPTPMNSYAYVEPRHLRAEPSVATKVGRAVGAALDRADAARADRISVWDEPRWRAVFEEEAEAADRAYRSSCGDAPHYITTDRTVDGEWLDTLVFYEPREYEQPTQQPKNHRTFAQVDLRDCDCRGCVETVRLHQQGTTLTPAHLEAAVSRLGTQGEFSRDALVIIDRPVAAGAAGQLLYADSNHGPRWD